MTISTDEMNLFGYIQESYQSPNLVKFMALTEVEKAKVGKTLIDQIYVNIAEKYNEIDFETIPKSAGKITSMKEYDNLKSSIALLEKITLDTHQNVPEIKTLSLALSNIEKLENSFYTGFVKKNAQIIMTYNLLAMSLYCGASLMISVLVDYVNLANEDTVELIITRKYSKNNNYLMINALDAFNELVRNGSFSSFIANAMKPISMNEATIATISLIIAAIIGVFKIIPAIKELIYIFYYSRLKVSEATAIQASLISAHVDNIKVTGNVTPKTVKIQTWFADKLLKLSQFFAIKYEKSEKEAQTELATKLNKNDVVLF